MSVRAKPYLLVFSKRCKLSVGALQALVSSPVCPLVELVCVEPQHEFQGKYPALARIIRVVPTLLTPDDAPICGFSVLNWIREQTMARGGLSSTTTPSVASVPGMEELAAAESKGGIVSDVYSYLTESSDNAQTSDAGMLIAHSYASLQAAYSGPPSVDGGSTKSMKPGEAMPGGGQYPGGPHHNGNSGGGGGGWGGERRDTRNAKQKENDDRMEEMQRQRQQDVPGPPMARIGGGPQQYTMPMKR